MEFPIPDAAARAALLDRAAEADLALRLRLGGAPAAPRPTHGDIWRAAHLGDAACRARVEAAAQEDAWVAATFRDMMAGAALALFEEVRAAATGDIAARRAGAYALEVRASANRPDRAFLIVTCEPGAPAPRRLVVHPAPGKPAVADLDLPEPADGVVQVVLPAGHPVLAALADPERSFQLG